MVVLFGRIAIAIVMSVVIVVDGTELGGMAVFAFARTAIVR